MLIVALVDLAILRCAIEEKSSRMDLEKTDVE
jgi:hypothetical protein